MMVHSWTTGMPLEACPIPASLSFSSSLTLCSVLTVGTWVNAAAAAAHRPKGDLLSSCGMMHYLVHSWLKWK